MPVNREYRLLNRVLQTDYAETYRAIAQTADGNPEPAYVHVLAPRIAEPEVLLRIKQHTNSLSGIRFPNLVVPWEVGRVEDRWALAMSGAVGHHLDHVLARCRARELTITLSQAVHLVAEIANELSALHRGGLCHGGLGPDDMILCFNGSIVLHCNGLRFVLETLRPTRHLAQRGRKRYRAPELSRGAPPGAGGDVFALGAVAFELLTGQAFEGALRPGSALRADPALLPSRLDRRIPTAFDPILLQAIEPVASRRYEDAESFRDALWEYLDGMGEVVTPAQVVELASCVLPNEVMPRSFDPNERPSDQVPFGNPFTLDTGVALEDLGSPGNNKSSSSHFGIAPTESNKAPVASTSYPMPAAHDEDEIRTDAGDPPDDFLDPEDLLDDSTAEPSENPHQSRSLSDNRSGVSMQVKETARYPSKEAGFDELASADTDRFALKDAVRKTDFARPPTQDGTVFVTPASVKRSPRASAAEGQRSSQGDRVLGSENQDRNPTPSMQTRLVSTVHPGDRENEVFSSPPRQQVRTALHSGEGQHGPWDWMTIPIPLALVVAAALVIASLAFAVGRLTAPSMQVDPGILAAGSSESGKSSQDDDSSPSTEETGDSFR